MNYNEVYIGVDHLFGSVGESKSVKHDVTVGVSNSVWNVYNEIADRLWCLLESD